MNDIYAELIRERFTQHIRTEEPEPTDDETVCLLRQKELLNALNETDVAA